MEPKEVLNGQIKNVGVFFYVRDVARAHRFYV